jgi:hypothetical protein
MFLWTLQLRLFVLLNDVLTFAAAYFRCSWCWCWLWLAVEVGEMMVRSCLVVWNVEVERKSFLNLLCQLYFALPG